jgi:5-methylcytosine-specific restriction protein B
MARTQSTDPSAPPVYQAAERFRDRCLLAEGSLLFDQPVWTADNIAQLQRRLSEGPAGGERPFEERLQARLRDAPRPVVRLAAEALALTLLFPSDVSGARKRRLVGQLLGLAGDALPEDHELARALEEGIGPAGPGFHARRPLELGFLLAFAAAWRRQSAAAARRTLQDPWRFQAFLDEVDDAEGRQLRHALLHLLFPAHFERIISGDHKRRAARAFAGLLNGSAPTDIDRCLHAARKELSKLLPGTSLDFYEPPLAQAWYDPAGDVELLRHKKQVVLYGPPGTGKSHRARTLAERIIHAAALERWGAGVYFREQEQIAQAVRDNVHFVPLHGSLTYQDFVRGPFLATHGQHEYRPGILLQTITQMQAERPDRRLPHVLILDEMNRADLSRLFGECFALLEDRAAKVRLPGVVPDGTESVLSLPPDLYFVGTLNLIDQSLEQIDFALRRRFLWLECGFDADELLRVLREKWMADPAPHNGWDRIEPDCRRLVAAARALNRAIAQNEVLGRSYEIGHTWFFDVLEFLRQELAGAGRARKYLLYREDQPLRPVQMLWELSLRPLLAEYLAGLRGRERDEELERYRELFFRPPQESE